MSKIILSSCDFRNGESAKCIYDNLPHPVGQCKVLYFPNEKATEEAIKSIKFYQRLSEFGFSKENIYIFNYFSPAEFDANTHIDVIYISGGNTLGTMKLIRDAGFDKAIIDYVHRGVVYIGGSAGAHIATVDIAHVAKYDKDTFGLTDFSGLGLYNGILICHYTEDRKADFDTLNYLGKYRVILLSDDQSIIVKE